MTHTNTEPPDDHEPPEYARDTGARLPEYRPLYRQPGQPPPPLPPLEIATESNERGRRDTVICGVSLEVAACAAGWMVMFQEWPLPYLRFLLALSITLIPIVGFLFTARRRALPASLVVFAILVAGPVLTCAAILLPV